VSNQNTISPAIVVDRNTRTVLQSYRTQIDILLGNSKNTDLQYVSRKEFLDTGLVSFNQQSQKYISQVVSELSSGNEGFLSWLQGNFLVNTFQDAAFTIGAEAANIINVSVQLQDNNGTAVTGIHIVDIYLSNVSTAASFASTVPDTSVTIGTNGALQDLTGGTFIFRCLTNSSGVFDVNIEHTAVTDFYMSVKLESQKAKISSVISFT